MKSSIKYPRITIITPSFNQGKYIERTIKSVLGQGYPNLEYIIVDGGSTDNTITILKKYSKKIKWISEPDAGQADAINKGIRMSTGKVLGFLNSDDTYARGALKTVGDFFKKNEIVRFIYGIGKFVNSNDRVLEEYSSFQEYQSLRKKSSTFFDGCYICQPTAFWRKEVVRKIGFFDTKLHYALDYDYWIRAEKHFQFHYLPVHLACSRLHVQSKSIKDSLQAFQEMARVQLKYFHKIHYGVLLNIAELELQNFERNSFFTNAAYLLQRIYKNLYLHLRYNHSLPNLKVWYYFLVWIKEIFIYPKSIKLRSPKLVLMYKLIDEIDALLNSAFKSLVKTINSINLIIYYFFTDRREFINRLILIAIKNRYVELGKLIQYAPKRPYIERFSKSGVRKFYTISIVTPSFNQGKFIGKTIESVVKQNYPNIEYIVQDGGSTDNTDRVVRRYIKNLAHYESKKDRGQAHAINLGFVHTTGEIMAYLNSDDLLMPGSLFFINDYFQKHPEVDVIYGHRIIINQNGKQIGRWVLYKHIDEVVKYVDYVPQETLFWRRRIWEKIGGKADDSFRFAMDWDLLMRFINAKAKIVRVPYFLGMFRVHAKQKTSAQIETVGKEEWGRILKKYHQHAVSEDLRNETARDYVIRSGFISYLLDKGIRI